MTTTILVVQHEDACPPGLVGEWLREEGCTLDVRRPYAGDALPDDLEAYDGLLVLGGEMGADDDRTHHWIGPVKELVREAAGSGTATLGICLGHQLIASALGGVVVTNPLGTQVGLVPVRWEEAAAGDPLLGALRGARREVHWNDDVVSGLPPGATLLGQTERGEVQSVRYGPRMWGVQHHPEVDHDIVGSWIDEPERADLLTQGIVVEDVLAEIAAARGQLTEDWRPLAVGFARIAGS